MILNFFRTYSHPKVITIMFLGFSSGLPRLLVASTLGVWLLESGVDKTTIGLFAWVAIPYSFNFGWAPLIDHLKLPYAYQRVGRRRSWMLFTQLALITALLALATTSPGIDPWWTALFALLVAFFSASQDVVIDAYRTEYLDKSQYGEGAAMAVFGYRLGMLAAGAGALFMAASFDWATTYTLMAALMGVGIATALITKEPNINQNNNKEGGQQPDSALSPSHGKDSSPSRRELEARSVDQSGKPSNNPTPHASLSTNHVARSSAVPPQGGSEITQFLIHAVINPFKDFMTRYHSWWIILLFILFYRAPDGFIGFMTTPFMRDIGFDKETIASVGKLYGFGATILGMFIGGAMIGRLGVWKCLWIFGIFQIGANLTYMLFALSGPLLGMLMFSISMDNLSGGMVTAVAIAFMMRLCNPEYTATQYALLASLASLVSIVVAGSAGWLAEHYGWASMFGASALLGLPAMVLLTKLKSVAKE